MSVTVETLEKLQRRITLQVPKDDVLAEVEVRLKAMLPKVRLDGFRVGKVPLGIVRKMYAGSVMEEALTDKLNNALFVALAEQKLLIAGDPTFGQPEATDEAAQSTNFIFTASFEVLPTIPEIAYHELELEKIECQVSEGDIDETLDEMRKQQRNFVSRPEGQAAQHGDRLYFLSTASQGDEAIEQLSGTKNLVLGESGNQLFEDAMVGVKVNEEREVELPAPSQPAAENGVEPVAKPPIKVKAKIMEVAMPVLPELDASFVKSFGIESGSLEELRNNVRENLERETHTRIRSMNTQHVLNALDAKLSFDVPEVMVNGEAQALADSTRERMIEQKLVQNTNDFKIPAELMKDRASKRVKLGLIFGEVAKRLEIKTSDADVQAVAMEQARAYADPQAAVSYFLSNDQSKANLRALALEIKVVTALYDKAKVTSKTTSLAELKMLSQSQAAA